tara:strand:- start:4195 stop:4443 length:249 start_codon:yes stop_codon:yes gene_type:complete
MKHKISNLIKENYLLDTKTFNSLSPSLKEAVNDVVKLIEINQKDVLNKFDDIVNKVSVFHNVNKEKLYHYIDKETNEQLGVN